MIGNKFRQGYCPDRVCNERLIFEEEVNERLQCHFCGNFMSTFDLRSISPINDDVANRVKKRLEHLPKRTDPEWTRVAGLSQFACKQISSLFTIYGITHDWYPALLLQLGFKKGFDARLLADRAFVIQQGYIHSPGYGIDESCAEYLAETLNEIQLLGPGNCLIPLMISTRGLSLLQCFSRALVGREIFWHPLGQLLNAHWKEFSKWYAERLSEFDVDENDWEKIQTEYSKIDEVSEDSTCLYENNVLRIFALSNILCRPVILLNAVHVNKNKFDSRLFVPILRTSEEIKRNNKLIRPLVIAWTKDSTHARLAPLVGIQGKPKPKLHRTFLPEPFLCDKSEIEKYIEFDSSGFCIVADGRRVHHLSRMIRVMQWKYNVIFGIDANLICGYVENILDNTSEYSIDTLQHINEFCSKNALFRCLICWSLSLAPEIPDEWLANGGYLFNKLRTLAGNLRPDEKYTLQPLGCFIYNAEVNNLEVVEIFVPIPCFICRYNSDQMRYQDSNNCIRYFNGDHSRIPAVHSSCGRQMKHFWDGGFHDKHPLIVSAELRLQGKKRRVTFNWFEGERDKRSNTDIVALARNFLRENFQLNDTEELLCSLIKQLHKAVERTRRTSSVPICREPLWSFDKGTVTLKQLKDDEEEYSVFLLNFLQESKLCLEKEKFTPSNGRFSNKAAKKEFQCYSTPISTCREVESKDACQLILSDGRNKYTLFPKKSTFEDIEHVIHKEYRISNRNILGIFSQKYGMITRSSQDVFDLCGVVFIQLISTPIQLECCSKVLNVETAAKLSNSIRMYVLRLFYDLTIGTDIYWTFIGNCSNLLAEGGTVCEFVKTRSALVDNAHYMIKGIMPNKTLAFNSSTKKLDLCLADLGHFDINCNIRNDILACVSSETQVQIINEWIANDGIARTVSDAADSILFINEVLH